MGEYEEGLAFFSPDREYRYWLTRDWSPDERRVMWIGLNPSTADEAKLDPTLRRILGFSKDWGYSGFVMTNLFAFRATDPKNMKALKGDPVGPDNDGHLLDIARESSLIICCWGVHGAHMARDRSVLDLLCRWGHGPKLHALRVLSGGAPGHPLYLPQSSQPAPFK